MYAVMAGFAGWLALVVWWLFFSRAAWFDRIAAIVGDDRRRWPRRIRSSMCRSPPGRWACIFPMLAIPGICLAFVIWAVVSRPLADRVRA